MAWQVALAGQGQLRLGLGGIIAGFDLPALLQLGEAMGAEKPSLAALLPQIERGLLAGIEKQRGKG